jgi:hypothetical protein
MAGTLLLGVAAAAALAAGLPPQERTFAALSAVVQSLMSVLVPLLGILLVRDLRRAPGTAGLASTLAAAVLVAAGVGVFGAVATALVLAPSGATDAWGHAAVTALGGVLVQLLAVLVGTGMALLLRPVPLAFLATFLPLAVWAALDAVDVLRPARQLTPYETARDLLSGDMSPAAWLQWLVVVLVWGVGLNAAGAVRGRGISAARGRDGRVRPAGRRG